MDQILALYPEHGYGFTFCFMVLVTELGVDINVAGCRCLGVFCPDGKDHSIFAHWGLLYDAMRQFYKSLAWNSTIIAIYSFLWITGILGDFMFN